MRAFLVVLILSGVLLAGCAQLANYGSKDSPKAPPLPLPTATSTAMPTASACTGEGESLGAAVSGNTAQCCVGLVAYVPDGIVGTRGTCILPEDVPTATPAATTKARSGAQVANPASAHCIDVGYSEAFDNERTQCRFSDGTSCDEWEFYRGKCGQEFSACTKAGGELTSGSGRIGSAFFQFGLCTFSDGSQCGEGELASGKCQEGQCKAWTAQGCTPS